MKRRGWPLLVALLVLASRLLLAYRTSSPEPDSLAMVAGMTMALRGDVPLAGAFLYGREGSPGTYLIGHFIYPLLFRDPSHLLSFLNWFTMLASAAMVWPLWGIARRLIDPRAAIAAVVILLLTPAVWELSTYFHPEIPATAFLLFAVQAAAGADRSRAGVFRTIVAMLLGAGAILLRVHVLFALPGLLAAALLSRRRMRSLAILAGALAMGVGAYLVLQGAVAHPDRAASAGFTGYVSMIASMYARGFSIPGLARSTVWAAFGLGIASIAVLVAWSVTRRRLQAPRRLAVLGIVWALPSLLFWLPQPVPILRHYVLPAFGIVLALASVALAGRPLRTLLLVASMVVAGNVAVPEIAYRAYNARHPEDPKTPHGAVFYTHGVMVKRIARFDRLAGQVVDAARATSCPGVVVFTQWEGYAHTIYRLAETTPGLHPTSTSTFFESVQERRFEADSRRFRFINYVYFEDPELKRRGVELMRRLGGEGYAVFVPRELADGPLAGMLPAEVVSVY